MAWDSSMTVYHGWDNHYPYHMEAGPSRLGNDIQGVSFMGGAAGASSSDTVPRADDDHHRERSRSASPYASVPRPREIYVSEATPQHAWTQIGSISTAESLAHLVVRISNENVTTFFCRWDGCKHPVGFRQKPQLITHIRSVHLQEKPFRCTTCGTLFSRKQEAIRHVNSMNSGRKYKCSFCARAFVRRNTRDNHEDNCMSDQGGSLTMNDVHESLPTNTVPD